MANRRQQSRNGMPVGNMMSEKGIGNKNPHESS